MGMRGNLLLLIIYVHELFLKGSIFDCLIANLIRRRLLQLTSKMSFKGIDVLTHNNFPVWDSELTLRKSKKAINNKHPISIMLSYELDS